jgi:hypothetical protein
MPKAGAPLGDGPLTEKARTLSTSDDDPERYDVNDPYDDEPAPYDDDEPGP